jgi:hypothetical protein
MQGVGVQLGGEVLRRRGGGLPPGVACTGKIQDQSVDRASMQNKNKAGPAAVTWQGLNSKAEQ